MYLSPLQSTSSLYAVAANSRSEQGRISGVEKESKAGEAQSRQLSAEDQKQVEKLKARDREVRQHEQAHLAASGGLATSGASFTYQKGPDGVSYAVGGEVSIDTSSGSTPEETIRRAQTIRAAATAPADPSGQDRAVAAQAAKMEMQARIELAQLDSQGEGEKPAADRPDQGTANRQAEVGSFYAASEPGQRSAVSAYA